MNYRSHCIPRYENRETERGLRETERGLRETERGLREIERGLREIERGLREIERGLREIERGLREKYKINGEPFMTDLKILNHLGITLSEMYPKHPLRT